MNYDDSLEIKKRMNFIPFLVILSIFFLPAVLVGVLFWEIFFHRLKWRPSVLNLIFIPWLIILIITSMLYNPILNFFPNWILSYSILCAWVCLFLSTILVYWSARQIKKYPKLLIMEGWAKNFEYAETPWDKNKKKKLEEELRNGEVNYEECAPIGLVEEKFIVNNNDNGDIFYYEKPSIAYRYYEEAYTHTIITGSTGSGKSITMLNLLKNDFENDFGTCLIDFKQNTELAYWLSLWAHENNRPFYHFVGGKVGEYQNPYSKEQATYDPLDTGDATEKANLILNMREWDAASEIYKKRTMTALITTFRLLENADKRATEEFIPWGSGGFAELSAALKVDNLLMLIDQERLRFERKQALGEPISKQELLIQSSLADTYELLTDKRAGAGFIAQLNELRDQLKGITFSMYGNWVIKGNSNKHIDLTKLFLSDEKPVILFQFNPLKDLEYMSLIGNVIMTDLGRAFAEKQRTENKNPFGLYIDEAQAVNSKTIATMLEKVRSTKIFVTISLQSLEQIVTSSDSNGEAIKDSIIDTVKNFIVHAGSGYNSSETFAKIVGKIKKVNYKAMGGMNSSFLQLNWGNSREAMVTTSIDEDWAVPIHKIQNLSSPLPENNFTCEAYYITKATADPEFAGTGRILARKVRVLPPDSILSGVPKSFIKLYNQNKQDNTTQEEFYDYTEIDLNKTKIEEEINPVNYTEETSESLLESNKNEISKTKTEEEYTPNLARFSPLRPPRQIEKEKKKEQKEAIAKQVDDIFN